MNDQKAKLDRLEQALWQAPPPAPPSAPVPPVEVWQANVMRAVRLAAPEAASLLDLPWLALRRVAVAVVLMAALGWTSHRPRGPKVWRKPRAWSEHDP